MQGILWCIGVLGLCLFDSTYTLARLPSQLHGWAISDDRYICLLLSQETIQPFESSLYQFQILRPLENIRRCLRFLMECNTMSPTWHPYERYKQLGMSEWMVLLIHWWYLILIWIIRIQICEDLECIFTWKRNCRQHNSDLAGLLKNVWLVVCCVVESTSFFISSTWRRPVKEYYLLTPIQLASVSVSTWTMFNDSPQMARLRAPRRGQSW